MKRVYRKDKIKVLEEIYRSYLMMGSTDNDYIRTLNQIIIDSIGESGLVEVKKKAWRKTGAY